MQIKEKEKCPFQDVFDTTYTPDDDVSDVIITLLEKGEFAYHNVMTGERGKTLRTVIRDRDYTCDCMGKDDDMDYGYYVKYDEDKDIVIYYLLTLDLKNLTVGEKRTWSEGSAKYVFTRDGNVYGCDSKSQRRFYMADKFDIHYVDIYAKTFGNEDTPSMLAPVFHTHAIDVFKKFYGTFIQNKMEGILYSNIIGTSQKRYMTETVEDNPFLELLLGGAFPNEKSEDALDEHLAYELPDVDKNLFVRYFEWENGKAYRMISYMKHEKSLGVIQKIKPGHCVIRIFDACIEVRGKMKSISAKNIEAGEVTRIYVDGYDATMFYLSYGKWKKLSDSSNISKKLVHFSLVPFSKEDVEGTVFEHMAEQANKLLAKHFETDVQSDKDCLCRQYPHSNAMTNLLINILDCPYVKSIYESPFENIKDEFTNAFLETGAETTMKDMFNVSWNDKTHVEETNLMKVLDVPTHMMKTIDKVFGMCKEAEKNRENNATKGHSYRWMLPFLKTLYASCPEYFRNMNKEQFEELAMVYYEVHCNTRLCYYTVDSFCYMVKYLVELHGPKNMISYMNYVYGGIYFESTEVRTSYLDYLEMCNKLKNADIKISEWKFDTVQELLDAHDRTVEVFNANIEFTKYDEKQREKFQKAIEEEQKYLYEEESFSVIAPSKISDIINEGYKLHHCVGGYVDNVIDGRTDILFIRKTDNIEKPFYTLEVRNGAVRQCHGFGNCNVEVEAGLEDFLRRFCEEKDIRYGNTNRLLAAM